MKCCTSECQQRCEEEEEETVEELSISMLSFISFAPCTAFNGEFS